MIKEITIGRNPQNDIVVADSSVSSFHATIKIFTTNSQGSVLNERNFEIVDNNSTNGTYVNGEKVKKSMISETDTIKVGSKTIDWYSYIRVEANPINNVIETITIGRSDKCDIVINYPNVSSVHAKILTTSDGSKYIVDNRSTNGTYVNNKKIIQKKLVKGDLITLSNHHLVDWDTKSKKTNFTDSKKTTIEALKSAGYFSKFNVRKKIIIGVCLLIVVGIATFFIQKNLSSFNPSKDYNNSVVLIYHSYLYKVMIGNEVVLYLTYENGKIVPYNKVNTPISITGTGFIVSKNGEIITNRHVAMPWAYDDNIANTQEQIKTALTESITTQEDLFWVLKNLANIEIKAETLFLGIAYNDTYVNSLSDFSECILKKESGDKEIDVACIQLKSKTIPDKIKKYIHLEDAVLDYKSLNPGDKVYMVGYPAGFTIGNTKEGLKVNFQNGQLTRDADNICVGHNIPTIGGGSGSPIFDRRGRLIAVNNAGMTNTQGFNFAIVAKHAVSLLK